MAASGTAEAVGATRPGGLTVLVWLNVLYALNQLGAAVSGSAGPGADLLGSGPWHTAAVALAGVNAVLLVVSAVGYHGQRRVLGRGVGLLYGVVGAIGEPLVGAHLPLGFGLDTILGTFYPAFTLALLLTVFRRDFHR